MRDALCWSEKQLKMAKLFRRRRIRSRIYQDNYAATLSRLGGREQLAIEAYADAVEAIPLMLAENAA
jgi:hypothetical protein